MEFPTTNLYELESRVFTDHWSIPYKREESLGKCLIASTCLARHGKNQARNTDVSICLIVWVSCLVWIPLIHVLILDTYVTRLNLYACRSQCACVFFVFFLFPLPTFGCDFNVSPLCQVSPTPTRTASASWIAACQRPLKRRVTKPRRDFSVLAF